MRNPLTDTPDWRYGTALAEITREQSGLPVYDPCDDVFVHALKHVIPLRSGRAHFIDPDKRISSECLAAAEVVLRIYEDQSTGGLRDTMEAALLAEDTPEDFFQTHVARGLNVPTIQLYREMFYDIQDDRDLKFWVHRNLFVPNKSISNKEKFDTAYMWKVVAYHGGIKYFIQYAIDGLAIEEDLRGWIRHMGVSEYVKQVLKSSHSYAKLLDGAGTPALPMAATWDKQDNDGEQGGDEALIEASAAIAESIKEPEGTLINAHEYMASQKYTDED